MPLTHTHRAHTRRHTQAASHMARAECVVLWLPNEIIAAALHPLLGLLAFACVSLCAFVYICVSLCTYVAVCVCVLLRASHNCSNNKLLAIAFPFLYALRLLCAWLVPVLLSLSLSPFSLLPPPPLLVIEYIILFYLPHTHTHTRARDNLAYRVSGI